MLSLLPWVFLSPNVNGSELFTIYAWFADGTKKRLPRLAEPLMDARPAEQMTTLRYDWFSSRIETDSALVKTFRLHHLVGIVLILGAQVRFLGLINHFVVNL